MAKPPRPWIVTPHGPLQKHEDNLWSVESPIPGIPGTRRMIIVRLGDGSLVFYNAVPLDEATLAEVRAWGKPTSLVITHGQHGIDAVAFGDTLGLKRYGPKKDAAEMKQKFVMAGTLEEMPTDATLTLQAVEGTKRGEAMALVRSGDHVTAVFSDVYQDHSLAPFSVMMWLMGFTGGPQVARFFRWFMLDDKPAVKVHLERIAATPGLFRILPSHGPVMEKDPAGVLRAVAAAL